MPGMTLRVGAEEALYKHFQLPNVIPHTIAPEAQWGRSIPATRAVYPRPPWPAYARLDELEAANGALRYVEGAGGTPSAGCDDGEVWLG